METLKRFRKQNEGLSVSHLRILYLIFPCKTVFSYAANLRPLPLNVLLNLLTFAILPSSNTHTVILKKCHPILNVVWNVSSILSQFKRSQRNNLYLNIVFALNALLAIQFTLNGREMPGWNPLNENSVKTIIRNCTTAAKRSQNDINTYKETMIKGCEICRKKESVQIQEMLADFNEEELQKFIQEETQET